MGGDTVQRVTDVSGEPTSVVRVDKCEMSKKGKEYTLMMEAVLSSATWEGLLTVQTSVKKFSRDFCKG
jgi:hypothetical protein